jgi:DNA-binding MarR family transcriptional regulator
MKTSDTPSHTAVDAANQLQRSAFQIFRVLRAGRSAKGLTLAGFGVLGRLYRDGAATASELAAYLRIKPQSLTRLIADLEQKGFIARHTNDEDRRQSFLEITHAGGRALMEDMRNQRNILAQVIENELTSAEQELLRIAAGLMDRVAQGAETLIVSPDS